LLREKYLSLWPKLFTEENEKTTNYYLCGLDGLSVR